ncbi:MAG: amine dehydrogenase large subunit [Myxococcota bacterium]
MSRIRRRGPWLPGALALLALLTGPDAAAQPVEPIGQVTPMPLVGDHAVWVPDLIFGHSVLYDGDTGEVMASVDAGTTLSPKPPLYSPERDEFYAVEIDYSRGRRGDRTDYVTIYDAKTLAIAGEVVLPTRTSESAASLGYAALLDGGRFLATFNQFPNTSVSIVDLAARRFVGEIVTSGCAGIYPTGDQSFAMLCGNGSVLAVDLDENGAKRDMRASETFFDVIEDPLMMAGGRVGSRWVFPTFAGRVFEIDFAEQTPAIESWWLSSDAERASGWRPGGRQMAALHAKSGRFYVAFHQGEAGSHKEPGPEVWVFDLARRERVGRFEMPNFTAAFLGGRIGVEGGFAGFLLDALLPGGGADTIAVSQDDAPLLFARNSQLGAVAVLDAETGEHLRNLFEAGLAGMRLEVAR